MLKTNIYVCNIFWLECISKRNKQMMLRVDLGTLHSENPEKQGSVNGGFQTAVRVLSGDQILLSPSNLNV